MWIEEKKLTMGKKNLPKVERKTSNGDKKLCHDRSPPRGCFAVDEREKGPSLGIWQHYPLIFNVS